MNKRVFILLVSITFLIIIIKGFFLIQRPFIDNDEGIYLTSFMLVNKGYRLYQEVFFSQLPGFFLLVYPGFIVLGKSLFSARLMIFFWSLIGIIGVIWLFKELKKMWLALPAILLIWLVPKFSSQSTIFQSDILVSSFSLLSLVSLIRFFNQKKIIWLIISLLLSLIAFLTKLDFTSGLIILIICFLKLKKEKFKEWPVYFLVFIGVALIGLIFLIPFNLKELVNNVFGFRLAAAKIYPVSLKSFWHFLVNDHWLLSLSTIFIVLLIVNFVRKKISWFSWWLIFWLLLTTLLIILFRPIFAHHLSLLVMPLTISLVLVVDDYFQLEKNYRVILFISLMLMLLLISTIKKYRFYINRQEEAVVNLIKKTTQNSDWIVTDEAKFYYLTNRVPPPILVDISYVRVESGSLDRKKIQKIINQYKPKLIILWNGRLEKMPKIKTDLPNIKYKKLYQLNNDKIIYKRK